MICLTKKGLTLVEMLFVTAIFSFVSIGLYSVLTTGQNAWYTADIASELQQNLRNAMMRLTRELHQSGFKCSNPPTCTSTTVQVTILSGAGENSTDILRFKIPVDYNQDTYIKNTSGIVEVWGANMTWGCSSFSCQKPLSPEFQTNNYQIEYLVDANRQLLRRVLDDSLNPIATDVFSRNIQGFQVILSGSAVTINLSVQKVTMSGKTITANLSSQVLLRNRG